MAEPDLVFFDGACGLCHRLVRFLVRRDPACRFAPLQGPTFRDRVPEAQRAALAEALVVLQGPRVLSRSDAVLHLMRRAGGFWAFLAALAWPLPRGLRDWAYDRVARLRHRLFRRPRTLCPRVPPELRGRFLP